MLSLYIIPEGGMANRMRAIASGVSLARKTGRKPIVIWHRDRGLNARFADIFILNNLPFQLKETSGLKYNILYEQPRKANFFISALISGIDGRKRIYQDVNKNFLSDEKEIEKIVDESSCDVIIKSGLVFHPIDRELMQELFHYNSSVAQRIEEIISGVKPDYTLQIRRTDNVNSIANSPIEAFEKIAARLIRENVESRIFLATDDEPTKERFRALHPDNIICNKAAASRNTKSGIVDAAAELYIMASTCHIYGSYWSSYSEIASLLGGVPLTVVKR